MTTIYEYLLGHWLTLHGLIVTGGLAFYVTTSHTLHLRRHPTAAIAWVVALFLLPYVALPLYLIFGIRKVKTKRTAVQQGELAGSDLDGLRARTQQLATIMSLPAASHYHKLCIHEDGTQALQALLNIIDCATHTIDLCTFVFARDELGEQIARNLKRRAREGIRVRILIDGVGAYLGGHVQFKDMADAGIHVALFIPPLRSTLRGRTNLRNHRKMVVADGKRLWCGGRNLAAEYFAGAAASLPWIDLSFDLQGALAGQAQQQFEHDWRFATHDTAHDQLAAINPELLPGTAIGQLIASGPDQLDDTLYTLLVSGFFLSRKRILAVTPYFVPNPILLMSLTLAARRGVRVDLLMPKKSNHLLADFARHRSLRELTTAGAHVCFLPQMIHAKAVVIDDDLALVGSANLDERSLFLNYELMIAFYEPTDVKRYAAWIERQCNSAELYRAQPPRLWQEIAEGLLLWLAFQL